MPTRPMLGQDDTPPDGWLGLDIGPESEKSICRNHQKIPRTYPLGERPVGVFEFDNFEHGSRAVAEGYCGSYDGQKGLSRAHLGGGGDTVACVNKLWSCRHNFPMFLHGGGALLEMIEGKVLPGIKAIRGY